jgi:6,7-dimethyl-8-ribityllumazine synthase
LQLAIVVSEFNSKITFHMLEKAKEQAKRLDAKVSHIIYVPGAFDMPIVVEKLLKKRQIDAVVTLGAVIKGGTRHDDIVAENASRLIADLSLKYGKPVALGITGPGMTAEQARERQDIVPARAVNAAVNMVLRLAKLEKTATTKTTTERSGTVVIINDSAYDN